ncbi:MAG: type II secretion system GspH family protein [Proteobacteria bacterium]|nr:type II secretion system GspH family protein [Pseudomonadota bacterium]
MSRNKGFTLIEIIVTITIGAILAAMFVNYMGRAFSGSSESINILKETYEINQVIEKVTAAYEQDLKNDTLNLTTFKNNLAGFSENVTCSGRFLNYRSPAPAGNLIDSNADGIYEVQTSAIPTKFLLVTASKSGRSIRVLLTD